MATKEFDYTKLNAELEEIISQLQQDDLDIDVAMAAYERGLAVVDKLEAYLKTAENKVTKLKAERGLATDS